MFTKNTFYTFELQRVTNLSHYIIVIVLTTLSSASTSVRSFRIDKSFAEILHHEADRMGISVNAMMNSILKQYTEFTRFQSKLDMIVINRSIFKNVLKHLDEHQSYDLGLEMGKELPNDFILFWKKNISIDSVIEYIEKILCIYGRLGTYDEMFDMNNRIFVIRHRLGVNGSKFLMGYLKSLLSNMLQLDTEIQITDYSIKIQFQTENKTM
jgi:hypothetical protein